MIQEKKVWSWSLIFSLVINLLILAAVSVYWFSFRYVPPEQEEPIVVELLEIPAQVEPETTLPSEAELAELSPIPEVEEKTVEEEVQVKSEIATEVEQQKEETTIPKPEVSLPDSSLVVEKSPPSGEQLSQPGEDISVPADLEWQGLEAEKTIKAKLEEMGESTQLAHLAQQGAEQIESTVGKTLATGELTVPTSVEKKSPFTKRPIAIIVENAPAARPQSGLNQADIVYEIMTEGGITRFLAIYYSQSPQKVGPVRSARPYFILKAAEHEAIFAHCGGSVEAYVYLEQLAVDAIDEMKHFQAFWRARERKPPHNLFTSITSLREEAQRLGLNRPVRSPGFAYIASNPSSRGENASQVEIKYYSDYWVEFRYFPEQKIYRRWINGQPHIDEGSGEQIYCHNVIVQVTEQKVKDEEGRLEINFEGQGSGWLFSEGRVMPIRWEKPNLRDQTKFYFADGQEIQINPGKTWIQVISTENEVIF